MENFEIRVGDEIVLRLYRKEDTQELFNLIEQNRNYFRTWLPWLDYNTTEEDSNNFILECQKKYKNETGLNLGIFFKNKLVGSIGFIEINKLHKKAEIGYMLGKKWNGKGIMTKSCKAIVNYAFEKLNLNRVSIRCATKNVKSRAIPEKLGFKLEGIIEQNEWLYNHFVDHAHYGMLKENWQ